MKVYRTARSAPNRKTRRWRPFDYVVTWHGPEGRRRQKFTTPEAALDEARLKADNLAIGQIEAAGMNRSDRDELNTLRSLSGSVPAVAAMQEWKRARELTDCHVIAAAEAWATRNNSNHERITVADCVKRYLSAKTKAGIKTAENHASIFRNITTDFGIRKIDSIAARELDVWLSHWDNAGSRLTYRKWTVALFRWAKKQNYLDRSKITEAEHTDPVRAPEQRVGIITADTYAALLEMIHRDHPHYLAPLVIAGFCGLRRSEIHEQQWSDINLEAGHLRVTKGKRGTPSRRLVPLANAAVEWLMMVPERTEWVCPNLSMDRIRNIARDAGFNLPENCFRHSYVSHLVAQSGNIAETSLNAGNSPDMIRRHYLELVTKAEGEAWFTLTPAKKTSAVIERPFIAHD